MDARTPVGEQDVQVGTSPEDVPSPVDDASAGVEAYALPSPFPGPPVAREATAVATPETSVASSLSAEPATMFVQESSTGEGGAGMEAHVRHPRRLIQLV